MELGQPILTVSRGPQHCAHDEARGLAMVAGLLLFSLAAFILLYLGRNFEGLKVAYLVSGSVLGLYLYARHTALFLGFVWAVWFITPFARRFIDFSAGYFDSGSVAQLTPYVVTGLTLITVLRHGRRLTDQVFAPFLLVVLGVCLGYLVGVVYQGPYGATVALLEWLVPILLGFHVLVHWREYPRHRQVLRSTFTWGVFAMGLYGVLQFFAPPGWDALWMVGSEMDSIGKPEPLGLRVFSTLNAPGPFALVMMAGLLVLIDGRRTIHRLAVVPGVIAFLLTNVRAAWGGGVLALALLAVRLPGEMRRRLFVVIALSAVLSVPALRYSPSLTDHVGGRAETMGSLSEDGSFQARLGIYQGAGQLLRRPFGKGLGTAGIDSGVLSVPHVLGWPGAALYVVGLVWIMRRVGRTKATHTDQFAVIAGAIATTLIVSLIIANHLVSVKGVLLWTFMSMAMAAQVYYNDHANSR